MGVILADKMHSLAPLKHVHITYPTVVENEITPIYLGNTEPGTPTVTYTMTSGFFGSVTGAYDYNNTAIGYFAGKNTDAGSINIYVTVKLNSTTIHTASTSVTSGYYWTLSLSDSSLRDVVVNDVIDVYLHAGTADVIYLDYHTITTAPTSIKLAPGEHQNSKRRYRNFRTVCDTTATLPALNSGVNPRVYSDIDPRLLVPYKGTSAYYDIPVVGYDLTTAVLFESYSTIGVYSTGYGGGSYNSYIRTSSIYHPYYYASSVKVSDIYYLVDNDNN